MVHLRGTQDQKDPEGNNGGGGIIHGIYGGIWRRIRGGWLPTLDTNLRVSGDNLVQFKFYEKTTCSKKTVQRTSAMEENSKIQTVSNDLVRRLGNTRESMGVVEMCRVVDQYGQKLVKTVVFP